MRSSVLLGVLLTLAACESAVPARAPVFIAGRAVAPAGDSVFGVLAAGGPLLLLRVNTPPESLGVGVLHDPVTVQYQAGAWWASDLEDGTIGVVRLTEGTAERIVLGSDAAQAHQFGVLPDGGVVFEARDRRLVVRRGDSTVTFAPVDVGDRPSLLVGAAGGVLHLVPGRHFTLYNAFGHVRWRYEWPWVDTAHIAAVAVDALGRIHVLSGVADEGTFIVYTMQASSGEITRWSQPDSSGTFVVDRLGAVTADPDGRWRR